jgi:hypothetical protein
MPSNKKKRSKNQKKTRNRVDAAAWCAQCARPVPSDKGIECVCTRVIFCSEACQDQALAAKTHDCPGPPDEVLDLNRRLQEIRSTSTTPSLLGDSPIARSFQEELRRTVNEPIRAVVLADALSRGG